MEHVTACYWQKETVPNIFLSLQQRKYRRRKASVVYACISDNRELLMNLQNKIAGEGYLEIVHGRKDKRKMVETACGSGQKQQLCGSTVCGQQSASV